MRRRVVAANWKMNKTVAESVDLAHELLKKIEAYSTVDRVICPAFVALASVAPVLAGSGVALGAQNMHWEKSGAYTGEVSAQMLAGLCEYVIIGHSERRQYFGETDETVNKKAKAALANGLIPIVCVGGNLVENEAGRTAEVVGRKRAVDGDAVATAPARRKVGLGCGKREDATAVRRAVRAASQLVGHGEPAGRCRRSCAADSDAEPAQGGSVTRDCERPSRKIDVELQSCALVAQAARECIDPDDTVVAYACLGDREPAAALRADDAERLRRAELGRRAHTGNHGAERPAAQCQCVTGPDLHDYVTAWPGPLRLYLRPTAALRGCVELNMPDGCRRRQRGCACCDTDDGNEGKERSTHSRWIGRVPRSRLPRTSSLERGRAPEG